MTRLTKFIAGCILVSCAVLLLVSTLKAPQDYELSKQSTEPRPIPDAAMSTDSAVPSSPALTAPEPPVQDPKSSQTPNPPDSREVSAARERELNSLEALISELEEKVGKLERTKRYSVGPLPSREVSAAMETEIHRQETLIRELEEKVGKLERATRDSVGPLPAPLQRPSEVQVPAPPELSSIQSAAAYFAAESAKLDLLVRGSAAISAPSTAKVGEAFTASLRVSLKDLASVKQSLIDDFPENKTIVGKSKVKLTPRMEATLHGFGFEVSPDGRQQQAVSGNDATTWEWQVKATESGIHTLTFTLFGSLTTDGEKVVHNVYHYRQKVQVPIEPTGFLEKHWEKLLTAIVIPAVGGFWALFRKPKNSEGARQLSVADKLRQRRRQRATGHP